MKEQLEALVSIVRSAWRFRWSALLTIAIVTVLGTAGVLGLPGKYESRAQIYVDTKSVLRPLLQGLAVAAQAQDASDVVRKALLARPSLDKVARKTGLYSRAKTPEGRDKLLAELAELISIHGDSAVGLYTIAYADKDPRTAQAVVQTLLDTFVRDSVGEGRSDTQSAEKFLANQVLDYEKRLSDSEQQLADFKKKNIGLMPDQRGDYFSRLQAENAVKTKVQTDLAVAIQQRDELRRKISSDTQGGAAALAAPPSNQQIQSAVALDARIRDAKTTLDGLLDKFTDRHPQVVAQQEMIRRLEAQRQAELGGVRMTNGARTETSSVAIDPVMQSLQIALNNADVQIATLQTQLQQSSAQVADLQRTVTTGPQIEAELARLNRDYGVTKTQYELLLQRLETARISNDVDRSEELRFKILDPPRLPLRPIAPNRPLFLVGVLFFALALGFAVALLRGQTQPVFFTKSAVASTLNLPVIGVISRAYSSQELRARSHGHAVYGSAIATIVALIVVAAAFSFSASRVLRQLLGLGG